MKLYTFLISLAVGVLAIIFSIGSLSWAMYSRTDAKIEASNAKIDNLITEMHTWNMNFQDRLTRLEVKQEIEEKK